LSPKKGVSHDEIYTVVALVRRLLASGTDRASRLPDCVVFALAVSLAGYRGGWGLPVDPGDSLASCNGVGISPKQDAKHIVLFCLEVPAQIK
jgi:fermentation-respiration switch protein FrsA (DUF1100 family)